MFLIYSVGGIPNSSLKQLRKYGILLKPLSYAASDTLRCSFSISWILWWSRIFRMNSLPEMPVSALILR